MPERWNIYDPGLPFKFSQYAIMHSLRKEGRDIPDSDLPREIEEGLIDMIKSYLARRLDVVTEGVFTRTLVGAYGVPIEQRTFNYKEMDKKAQQLKNALEEYRGEELKKFALKACEELMNNQKNSLRRRLSA